MSERLLSVGVDVGTTTTQLILSELTVENRAGCFSVPRLEVTERKLRYKSPVHFTPLLSGELVDGEGLKRIVDGEYRQAGITPEEVDTGAVIITGETSRKENARRILEAISEYAGQFVVATAGPELESILAAKGAGATAYSRRTGKTVLHMDIGGGTSNLAWIEDGKITDTACLNVGGRLVKLDRDGTITYVSPVLAGLFPGKPGDRADRQMLLALSRKLVQALEMAAGLRERTVLLDRLTTAESAGPVKQKCFQEKPVISFSGGVADCIDREREWLAFGDMGPELGIALRQSLLCRDGYLLGEQTIRATVIGAGCHSTRLSGSTVYVQNVKFPLKDLPVVDSAERLSGLDGPGVLALEGMAAPDYAAVAALAQELAGAFVHRPVYLALREDMAKALGQQLALRLPPEAQILCMDRLTLRPGDYLDVGAPVGPALPVVIKTLVLER